MPALRAALGARCGAEGRHRQSPGGGDAGAARAVRSGDQLLAARGAGQAGRRGSGQGDLAAERREDDSKRRLQPGDAARRRRRTSNELEATIREQGVARTRPDGSVRGSGVGRSKPPTARRKRNCWPRSRRSRPRSANYCEARRSVHGAESACARRWRFLTRALAASGGGDLTIRERLEDAHLRRAQQQVAVAQRRAEAGKDRGGRRTWRGGWRPRPIRPSWKFMRPGQRAIRAILLLQYELGLRCKRAGKFKEAIQAFQAARDDARHKALVQLHLGRIVPAHPAIQAGPVQLRGGDRGGRRRCSRTRKNWPCTGPACWPPS